MVRLKFYNIIRGISKCRKFTFRSSSLQLLFSNRTFCHHNAVLISQSDVNAEIALKKIIYNDGLWKLKNQIKEMKLETQKIQKNPVPSPICLKYINEDASELKNIEKNEERNSEVFNFPYSIARNWIKESVGDSNILNYVPQEVAELTPEENVKIASPYQWLLNSKYDEKILENDNIDDKIKYGTCNPEISISNVPCGGCGAFLHCSDEGLPGYLPQEVFCHIPNHKLKSELCQRCYFLNEYNIALGVNVSVDEYEKILKQLKEKSCMIVLMVDLLDFPCCLWPGIENIIGNNPVVVVGNKIDLFVQVSHKFENQIKKSLINSLVERGLPESNIYQVYLISAKTGYGVESLIHCLNYKWAVQGDVYLMGSTNVGKSTLFNTLIRSDLCREDAEDVVKRATVSSWPGTTLNLLKFPMTRVHKDIVKNRKERMQDLSQMKMNAMKEKNWENIYNILPASFDCSVKRTKQLNYEHILRNEFLLSKPRDSEPKGIDPNSRRYKFSKWFHDTPGVVQKDQITNLLTTPELLLILPKNVLLPRNFLLEKGYSLFLGGLARLDYIEGSEKIWLTIYACSQLPVTVTKTEDAEKVYNTFLGTNVFQVPCGGSKRLSKWPGLSPASLEVCGKMLKEASADIVLSSAGWVAVYLRPARYAKMTAWTPEARGIHVRNTPVIATGHLYKGKRIRGTPAYEIAVNRRRAIYNARYEKK